MQKEYLQKLEDGSYKLVVLSDAVDGHDGLIEVPDGAEVLTVSGCENVFWKNDGKLSFHTENSENWDMADSLICDLSQYLENFGSCIVWQRESESDVKHVIDVDKTLGERQSQYGEFKDVAHTTQYLLQMLSTDEMSDVQLEALHMICSKLSRITHGDANHVDSWHDIAGYATLVVKDLESK
jgi:DNA-binding Xre family transcriptional regulator